MTTPSKGSLSAWIARHAIFAWIGIGLNLALIIPLLFDPAWILGILRLPLDQLLWARFAGLLLLIVSCYYVPATIDIDRYRINAWLAVVPSRSGGALFFFLAVFVFDQPAGFLVALLIDGFVGLATLLCLIKIETLERHRRVLVVSR